MGGPEAFPRIPLIGKGGAEKDGPECGPQAQSGEKLVGEGRTPSPVDS